MKKVSNIFRLTWFVLIICKSTFASIQNEFPSNIADSQSRVLNNVDSENENGEALYVFNGSDSYIELNDQFDNSFSFCAWIKPADLLKKNMAIVGIPGAFWLRTTTNRELQFTQPGFRDDNTEGLLLSANDWVFVSLVIDFPEVKIFLNSDLVGIYEWGRDKQAWQNKVFIGKDNWREDFYGSMQNIQVFKEAIGKTTIQRLFEKRPFSKSITQGIVSYHSFNTPKDYFSLSHGYESFNLSFLKDSVRGFVSDFNGRDSYIDYGDLPVDNVITISAWVKQSEFNRDYGAIAALGHAYAFRITTGGALLFTIPQMADILDNDAGITRDIWQHVAVTFKEGHGVTFYLNGEKTNFFKTDKYQPVSKSLQVGTNLWNDFYKGQMDDLVIWNKVLSDKELKEVFEKESGFWKMHVDIKTEKKPTLGIYIALAVILVISYVTYKRKKTSEAAKTLVNTDTFEQRIHETVIQNLSDSKFSVNEFSRAMNMSKTKLYNEIKTSVNKSPKAYIREIRIFEAARLLKETNLPIAEIIFETGFESRAYFNKCFKKTFNLTPSEYRKIDS